MVPTTLYGMLGANSGPCRIQIFWAQSWPPGVLWKPKAEFSGVGVQPPRQMPRGVGGGGQFFRQPIFSHVFLYKRFFLSHWWWEIYVACKCLFFPLCCVFFLCVSFVIFCFLMLSCVIFFFLLIKSQILSEAFSMSSMMCGSGNKFLSLGLMKSSIS